MSDNKDRIVFYAQADIPSPVSVEGPGVDYYTVNMSGLEFDWRVGQKTGLLNESLHLGVSPDIAEKLFNDQRRFKGAYRVTIEPIDEAALEGELREHGFIK